MNDFEPQPAGWSTSRRQELIQLLDSNQRLMQIDTASLAHAREIIRSTEEPVLTQVFTNDSLESFTIFGEQGRVQGYVYLLRNHHAEDVVGGGAIVLSPDAAVLLESRQRGIFHRMFAASLLQLCRPPRANYLIDIRFEAIGEEKQGLIEYFRKWNFNEYPNGGRKGPAFDCSLMLWMLKKVQRETGNISIDDVAKDIAVADKVMQIFSKMYTQ